MHNYHFHSNRPRKDFFSDYFISVRFQPNRFQKRLGFLKSLTMMIKPYFILITIFVIVFSACSKDPTQIPNLNPAHCSSSSESNTGHTFDYNTDPILLHFRWDEFISYKLYWSFDNIQYVLQESKTIKAYDFSISFGARHYFLEIQCESRMLEIDIQNALPDPYKLQVRSKCN